MELYKKLLKRIENDEPIYCNVSYAKDLESIAKKHYKQLPIGGVGGSLWGVFDSDNDIVSVGTDRSFTMLKRKWLLTHRKELGALTVNEINICN